MFFLQWQVLKKVEGDVLTGTCFVGLWDVWSLRWLLITPLVVYISIGTIFLAMGLFSLIKIRTLMKQDGGKTDKLEKLIMRIGIFSMLYTVPACIIIGMRHWHWRAQNLFKTHATPVGSAIISYSSGFLLNETNFSFLCIFGVQSLKKKCRY